MLHTLVMPGAHIRRVGFLKRVIVTSRYAKAYVKASKKDEGRVLGHVVEVTVLVFVAPNGTNHALNGTAKATLDHAADIEAIWADSADPGLKKDLGPLIDRGLKLC